MSNLDIPFNITILVLTPDKLKGIRPIRSMDIMDGNSNNFNPDGLFSTEIFGKTGDPRRSKRFSYIDIKIPILHPVIYKALVSLKRMYEGIISGTEYAIWDDLNKDFIRSDVINGRTGFAFFLEHWKEITFKETESEERKQNILLIHKYADVATTDKVVVMPAGLRDIEIDKSGRLSKDEINDFYVKFLSISNTISAVTIRNNPEVIDLARYNMQKNFNSLFDFIENMIKGKEKLIQSKWAARRVFNGTRNVITAMDTSSPYLGAPGSIHVNESLVSLYQLIKSILPVTIYHLKNGFLSKVFIDVNAPVRLVNKETRHMELVEINSKYYDTWMTDEGLEKVITSFSDDSVRSKPIEIEDHYIGLIYRGPDQTFKIIQDIDEVPDARNKEHVYPLSFCELIYLSCYLVLNKHPAFVTRYPILTVGSIYPCFPHVKTTIKSEVRKELNDSWEPMDDKHVAYEYPVLSSPYFNTLSPHSSKLKRLSGDFDR